MEMKNIDFLIIGAAKSATTWLQRCLQTDSGVYMPDPELHYFSREYHRGDAWYLSQFHVEDTNRLIGEKSNSYLDDPDAPGRIHKALPRAKLIVQMRNPVERAYSDYCMLYRRGEVRRNIEDHLDPGRAADGRFIANGQYRDQVRAYLDLFPHENFLFLVFEDLKARPERQIALINKFLGRPQQQSAIACQVKKVKDKTVKVVPPSLRPFIAPLKPIVEPFRKTRAFAKVNSLLRREIDYPALTSDLRARLEEHYSPQVDELEHLTGCDLSSWRGAA